RSGCCDCWDSWCPNIAAVQTDRAAPPRRADNCARPQSSSHGKSLSESDNDPKGLFLVLPESHNERFPSFPRNAEIVSVADLRANQELLQHRIDQLAQATKQYPGVPGALGTEAIPGQALIGGSFPRSFLIPGTDTSIRLGGFVDLTGLYFLQ